MSRNKIKLGLKTLKVKYHNSYVGTLALTNQDVWIIILL